MSKGRWAGIAAGIAVVSLLALAWMREPKTVWYDIIELERPAGCSGIDHLHINDLGIAAGTLIGENDESDHLFVWDRANGLNDIGKPDFMSSDSWIRIIDFNNTGQIVAEFEPRDADESTLCRHLFYDPQTGFRKIESIPYFQNLDIRAMNDRGQVVGTFLRSPPGGQPHPGIIVWDPETGMRDPDLAGWATAINESGHILGYDHDSVFLWSPEKGRMILENFPYGPVFYLHLNESDEIFGIADSLESSEGLRIFRWSRSRGYQVFHTIDKQEEDELPILDMNEQRVLYYQLHARFTWFGLLDPEYDTQIRLFAVGGVGLSLPRNLPFYTACQNMVWNMNRNGWIAGILYDQAYVMIPKGKAGKKKD